MIHHVKTPFFIHANLLYGTAKLAFFLNSCKLFAQLFMFSLSFYKTISIPGKDGDKPVELTCDKNFNICRFT